MQTSIADLMKQAEELGSPRELADAFRSVCPTLADAMKPDGLKKLQEVIDLYRKSHSETSSLSETELFVIQLAHRYDGRVPTTLTDVATLSLLVAKKLIEKHEDHQWWLTKKAQEVIEPEYSQRKADYDSYFKK